MKPFTHFAMAIFCAVALLHLLRLVFGVEVRVDGWLLPRWISLVGAVLPLLLAVLVWREAHQ